MNLLDPYISVVVLNYFLERMAAMLAHCRFRSFVWVALGRCLALGFSIGRVYILPPRNRFSALVHPLCEELPLDLLG